MNPERHDRDAMIAATYIVSAGPPAPSGALAIIEIEGDIDAALRGLGIAGVADGSVKLRRWGDVDELVVARSAASHAMLFPHASPVIIARATAAMEAAGIARRGAEGIHDADAMMDDRLSAALERAHSPLAIDVLLDQPARWQRAGNDTSACLPPELGRVLRRLIDPPLVVAMGPPNVGKSSTLNALAGRCVSIVADEPGTTRDHVGVLLDLGGLVVRYIDTPGLSANPRDELDAEAQRIARRVAMGADLLLLCEDARTPGDGARGEGAQVDPPTGFAGDVLRVGLRSDLAEAGAANTLDVAVSARTGAGLAELAAMVRERLVPSAVRNDPRAWKFWDDPGSDAE